MPQTVNQPSPIAEVLQRFRAGDDDAFREIYESHKSMVINVAAHMTGDRDLALDVAQEVFVRLYRAADRIREPAALSSWLYRVTIRESIDAGRREAVRRRPVPGPTCHEDDVADGLEREDEVRRMRAALARLSPKLREVAVLRYVEGLGYERIAEALDIRIGTVKSRIFRAHEALERDLIADGGDDDEPGGGA